MGGEAGVGALGVVRIADGKIKHFIEPIHDPKIGISVLPTFHEATNLHTSPHHLPQRLESVLRRRRRRTLIQSWGLLWKALLVSAERISATVRRLGKDFTTLRPHDGNPAGGDGHARHHARRDSHLLVRPPVGGGFLFCRVF